MGVDFAHFRLSGIELLRQEAVIQTLHCLNMHPLSKRTRAGIHCDIGRLNRALAGIPRRICVDDIVFGRQQTQLGRCDTTNANTVDSCAHHSPH